MKYSVYVGRSIIVTRSDDSIFRIDVPRPMAASVAIVGPLGPRCAEIHAADRGGVSLDTGGPAAQPIVSMRRAVGAAIRLIDTGASLLEGRARHHYCLALIALVDFAELRATRGPDTNIAIEAAEPHVTITIE